MTRRSIASAAHQSNGYHHGDLRNALITEGRRALEEMGVGELSLRHVARSIGVSQAAPARHFEGKEDLLAAIAADGFRELTAIRAKIASVTPDPMTRAFRVMECYVQYAQEHSGLFNLMVGPRILTRQSYPELAEASMESFELFAAAVCDFARVSGWGEKDLNLVVHAAWAIEHGLANLVLGGRVPRPNWPIDLNQMIRFSFGLLLAGIRGGPTAISPVLDLLRTSSKRGSVRPVPVSRPAQATTRQPAKRMLAPR